MKTKKVFTANEMTAPPRGLWGFANAVIGMIAGTDRFIGVDDAETEKIGRIPARIAASS